MEKAPANKVFKLEDFTIFANFDSSNLSTCNDDINHLRKKNMKSGVFKSKTKKHKSKKSFSIREISSKEVFLYLSPDNEGKLIQKNYNTWFYFGICGFGKQSGFTKMISGLVESKKKNAFFKSSNCGKNKTVK